MKNIIFIGPFSGITTGQSVALELISSELSDHCYRIDFGGLGFGVTRQLRIIIQSALKLIILLLSKDSKEFRVVLTPSRSKKGFLRDLIFILICKYYRLPIYYWLHGLDLHIFREKLSGPFRKINDWCYRGEYGIGLFPEMASQFSSCEIRKYFVLSNFINLSEYKPSTEAKVNETIRVGFLSNIYEEKGLHILIMAINKIHNTYKKSIELVIAGNIIDKSYFDELMKLCTVEVHYTGAVSGTAKTEFLNSVDLFVFCSIHPTECSPLTLLEAKACGCSVLSTDQCFLTTIYPSLTLDFFEVGNHADLATKIMSFIDRLGAKSVQIPVVEDMFKHCHKTAALKLMEIVE